MPDQTRTIDVAIDDARLLRLKEHARAEGISLNELVIRAIDGQLASNPPSNKKRDLLEFLLSEPRIDVGSPEELKRLIQEAHLSREYWDDASASAEDPDT